MYRNILVATDGSELATAAAREGIALAKSLGSKVTVIKVTEPLFGYDPNLPANFPHETMQVARKEAESILSAVGDMASAAGVPCKTVHVEKGPPYLSIIETAQAEKCDLIVMGSHGRSGIEAMFLGSHTLKVLAHSKIPVLVSR